MTVYTAAKIALSFGGVYLGTVDGLTYDDPGGPMRRRHIPRTKRYPGEGNRLARRTAAAKRKGGGK